jgi:Ca2+-binding EF-hand superfamily protein
MTRRGIPFALTLLAAATAAPAARAQQQGPINFVELFQMLDADNDTVITRGEVPESGRAAFDRLVKLGDTNKDGKIDRDEYRALLERARDSMGPGAGGGLGGGERFRAMDKNGDGKLSRDEFQGPPALFDRIDADKDGFVTRDEAMKFAGAVGPNQLGPRFQAMDKNGDNKVSRDEFTGPPALFDRIDTDKDGQIDPAENRRFATGQSPAAKKAARPKGEEVGKTKKEP